MRLFKPGFYESELYSSRNFFLTWEGIAAIAAVAAVGTTIYSLSNQPGYSSPPPPSSSVQYGEDGEVTSTQTYDAATNTWITRSGSSEPQKPTAPNRDSYITGYDENNNPVYDNEKYNADLKKQNDEYDTKHAEWQKTVDQKKADKQKLADLRTKMLDNLNTTPEDRIKAYAEYQQAYADSAHATADPAFQKIVRSSDEKANATGMFGSRAYVDTQAELTKAKTDQDTSIANSAAMAKEQLADTDRTYWSNMLNQIDSGARADVLTNAQVAKSNADITNQQYAGILGQYQAQNTINQLKQQQTASYANAGTNLAGGLLYLYGNKSKTSNNIAPTK